MTHWERRTLVMEHSVLPLVSMESLAALEESLEGQTALSRGFVARYVELWPLRYSRLNDAVIAGSWDMAAESALSLFSSSVMVGAERLGQMSGELVELLKQGRQQEACASMTALGHCGNETVTELTVRYIQHTI